MSTKGKKSDRSWRAIKQDVGKKPVTSIALKRRFVGGVKLTGFILTIFLIFGLIFTGVSYLYKNPFRLNLAGPSGNVREVQFDTDGVLDEVWLSQVIDFDTNTSLMQVDIYKLKEDLESFSQIEKAKVERIFPDALRIVLEERNPVLRLMTLDRRGQRKLLLLDKYGNVFDSHSYTASILKQFPYLSTGDLKKDKNGKYERIEAVQPISELLALARSKYPELYNEWQVVSYKNLDTASMGVGGVIKVRAKRVKEIVFSPNDFYKQLKRLDVLYATAKRQGIRRIRHIDLSLKTSAVVEVAGGEGNSL